MTKENDSEIKIRLQLVIDGAKHERDDYMRADVGCNIAQMHATEKLFEMVGELAATMRKAQGNLLHDTWLTATNSDGEKVHIKPGDTGTFRYYTPTLSPTVKANMPTEFRTALKHGHMVLLTPADASITDSTDERVWTQHDLSDERHGIRIVEIKRFREAE